MSEGEKYTRRGLLGALALAFGGIASLPLARAFGRRQRPTGPLPGDGSIFQPRRDARLEEWERRQGRPS